MKYKHINHQKEQISETKTQHHETQKSEHDRSVAQDWKQFEWMD